MGTAVAVESKSDQAVAVISVVVVAVTVLVVSGEVWADTVAAAAAAAVDCQHTGPTALADYTEPLAQMNWVQVQELSWGLLG